MLRAIRGIDGYLRDLMFFISPDVYWEFAALHNVKVENLPRDGKMWQFAYLRRLEFMKARLVSYLEECEESGRLPADPWPAEGQGPSESEKNWNAEILQSLWYSTSYRGVCSNEKDDSLNSNHDYEEDLSSVESRRSGLRPSHGALNDNESVTTYYQPTNMRYH